MRSSLNSDTWGSLVVMVGLALICFSGQLSGSGLVSATPSNGIRRMAAIYSGHFSNEEQVQKEINDGQTPRDCIIYLIHPVQMSLFGEDNETFFIEENLNGHLARRHIYVLGENDEGLIRLRSFNLTIPLPDSPGSVNISSLEDLTMDDLEYIEGCDPTYSELVEKVFLGKFPECVLYPPESNIQYSQLVTCDGFFFLSDLQAGRKVSPSMKPIKRFKLQTYSYEGAGKKELCPGTYE